MSDNKHAWNKHAARYLKDAEFSYDVVDYGDPRCDKDDALRLLPEVSGKTVLELGCGAANVGIALAKRGARVACVDFSGAQLNIARQKAQEHGVTIRFLENTIEELDFNRFSQLDLVISVQALQYVRDLDRVFSDVHRILKNSGVFVFSTNDPTFYSIAADILWKGGGLPTSYFYDGPEEWKWEEGDDFTFTTYRHPIDFYINTLIDSGFMIERFHQLAVPHGQPITEEERLESLYPRLMVFKCRKAVDEAIA